jgi:hypothetical protein
MCAAPGLDFYYEHEIQALEQHGVYMQEVHARMPDALAARNRARSATLARGWAGFRYGTS